MSELNEKLLEIKRQKDTYLLPENIKKDITVYGITGTLEPGSSGSGDVKLFDTVEEMQEDSNPQEGDLAVVYREELTAVTEESEFDSCIFPNTVILDTAFSDSIYGSFRAVDRSIMFDGMVDLSSSSFRFDGYGDDGEIRVEYESDDGITYTRTDGGAELQEFGVIVKWEDYEEGFNSVIGNFMKIGGNYFEGLYKYVSKSDDNYILSFTDIINTGSDISTTVENINISDIIGIIRQIISENALYQMTVTCVITNGTVVLYTLGASSGGTAHQYVYAPDIAVDDNQGYILHSNIAGGIRDGISKITVNLEQQTYVVTTLTHSTSIFDREYGDTFDSSSTVFFVGIDADNQIFYPNIYGYFGSNLRKTLSTLIGNIAEYCINSAQLDATSDYVYEKTFYGKNGVENGTLTTGVSNSFADVNAEVFVKIQEQYDNMQPRVLTDQDKTIDKNMYIVPSKLDGTSLIDTSSLNNCNYLFQGCKNLYYIPELNTANCSSMVSMFENCENLKYIKGIDTSNVTDLTDIFGSCKSLIQIPDIDTSNALNMTRAFEHCYAITSIPELNTQNVTNVNCLFNMCTNLVNIPYFDTSKVTVMQGIFQGCESLVTIPNLDTSNVTTHSVMFRYCTNLSNESLNKILAMCINATKITFNKTLKYIGLTQEQAQICTTLSNYSAFTAAGWTTGY